MPVLFALSQDRSMLTDFSLITMNRFDLNDEKLCRRRHDGVRKFSCKGMVKTREWGKFANHDEKKERY